MKNSRRTKILSVLVITITASLLLSGVSPVQAAATRDLLLKVHLASSTPVLTGALDSAVVKLTAIPFGTSYNGFDITVKADPVVLSSTRMVLGSALPSPAIVTYCINGAGINCGASDGPGISHLSIHSLTNGINGTLFKVSYKAINGVGVFGTVGTTVTIPCFKFTENGIAIAPTRFTVLSTTYGTLPANANPTATIASNMTSIAIKAGHTHNVTITTNGINGLSSTITLSAASNPLGIVLAKFASGVSPTVVSTDCGATPTIQLQLTPLAAGTFTVTVSATIHGAATTVVTPVTITVTGN